jgi:asparagine synthase (glutamine-hydrolysing)
VLAAYRAWGDGCPDRLEGDFSFILWDRRARRVLCARDIQGRRPLYYAELADTLVVASTIGGVLAHPDCPDDLNLVSIGETAARLFAASHETCYRAVAALPHASVLSWGAGRPMRLGPYWRPPMFDREAPKGDGGHFDAAAEELLELLEGAVAERLAPESPTGVQLSGGWDSTAVFGAGQKGVWEGRSGHELRPVSISYPPGDPGHEDDLIAAVATYWRTPVHWLDIRDIPLLPRPAESAAAREEPFAHIFEEWTRALARGTRAVGSRVSLDGNGGDQFFHTTEVYLAELLRRGRVREVVREMHARGGRGFRYFFKTAVQPNVPRPALWAAKVLRGGRPLHDYLGSRPPPWIARTFVRRHGLEDRERRFGRRLRWRGPMAREHHWYLTHPYFGRVYGVVASLALEEGVESRSPLYDRRIIEFAAGRPRWERNSGRDTKRLLRHAMRSLLPPEVLAPRPHRTGVTSGYYIGAMKTEAAGLVAAIGRSSVLAELGIVDPSAFHSAWEDFLRGTYDWCGELWFTLQAELWLRAHLQSDLSSSGVPVVTRVPPDGALVSGA